LGWTAGPDNLNPFIGSNSSAFTIWNMNYDFLVGLNTTDVTPNKTTGLANGWTTSADGRTWTFTIRQNAKWQDGVPLTAADVAWTYNFIIKNAIGNWTSYMTCREGDGRRRLHGARGLLGSPTRLAGQSGRGPRAAQAHLGEDPFQDGHPHAPQLAADHR
jgi:ABC-type transport system substrate-binding protein